MIERLVALWYRPAGLAYALMPIAILYRAACAARRSLYRAGVLRSVRLGVPVVVVGNVTAGGTGKTPLTLWLAESLAATGRSPGVVCRSYGATANTASVVKRSDDPGVRGDEAVLLATRLVCPVWSGPDRTATGRALLAAHADIDVLIFDDGLQHYALARDFEIAVIDAARGLGNGLPLPAGPLREPRQRLAAVDAIVINGDKALDGVPAATPRFTMQLQGNRFRGLADPSRFAAAESFTGKRLAAIAGIGNPARFFDHLRTLGLVFTAHSFPDHHPYCASDLRLIAADAVLMTEKDGIKCAAMADARMWVLPIAATLSDGLLQLVLDRIDSVCAHTGNGQSSPNQ